MGKRKDQETVIFRLPADVKKELQIQVLKEGTSVQELLENFVYDYLGMKGECKMKKNWIELLKHVGDFEGIELLKHVGDFEGMELWQAICHQDGHQTEGWALVGADDADFYESDPRELPDEDLVSGYRLPSYMPGHRPQG